MANPKELRRARQRLVEAQREYESIRALPRMVGDKVRWKNGVVWVRMGDNQWRTEGIFLIYSSAHVAGGVWERIEK